MGDKSDLWIIAVRVSSEEQASTAHVSLDTQEEACRKHVEGHGGTVAEVVPHVGSGLTPEAFYTAIRGALGRTGAKHVVVWRLDRLGREHVEAMIVCRDLARLGVEVVSATEPTESSFMRDLLFLMANEESRRISARVAPNMAEQAKRGYWLSSAPFGYRVVAAPDGRGSTLEPDENAWAVQEIFQMSAAGATEAELLAFVATYGLRAARSKTGKTLNRSSIRHILGNPAYIGKVVWNREGRGKFRERGKRPDSDVVIADGRHDPLVTLDTWNVVQRLLAERRTGRFYRKQSEFLLEGRVYCGDCGSRMRGHSHTVKGRRYRSYYCSARFDRADCKQPSVSADRIEQQVHDLIADGIGVLISHGDFLARLKSFRQMGEDARASTGALRKRLAQRRGELEGQRFRLLDMELADRCTPEEADRQRAEYDAGIAAIDSELERLPESPPDTTPIVDQLEIVAKRLSQTWPLDEDHPQEDYESAVEQLSLALDAEQWKGTVRLLVQRVELVGTVKDGYLILMWTETAKALLREEDVVSRLVQTARLTAGTRSAGESP